MIILLLKVFGTRSSDPIGTLTLKSIGKTLSALLKINTKNVMLVTLLDSPTTMTPFCMAPGGGLHQGLVNQPWKH